MLEAKKLTLFQQQTALLDFVWKVGTHGGAKLVREIISTAALRPKGVYSTPDGPYSQPFLRNEAAIQLIKDQLGKVDSLGKEIQCDAKDFEAIQYLLERAAEYLPKEQSDVKLR
jgi:hypothetical protein